MLARKRVRDFQRRYALVSDSTFTWNGGTGSASDETNWTVTGPANSPNVPLSDDSIVMTTGDAQFTNTPLPGPDDTVYGGTIFFQGGTIDMINAGGGAGILQQTLMLVSNTVAANATLTSQGDSTNNGTIDADMNGTLTFTVMSGVATNAGTVEATNGGSLQIFANGGASFVNSGSVIANGGGSVLISGSLGGTGGYFAMGTPGT